MDVMIVEMQERVLENRTGVTRQKRSRGRSRKRGRNLPLPLLIALAAAVILVVAGVLLLPAIRSRRHQSRLVSVISDYENAAASLDQAVYDAHENGALVYNALLKQNGYTGGVNEEMLSRYWNVLNIGKNGVMGYLEIPSISLKLPIYHGTSEAALGEACGHAEWSSVPIGEEGSHCVLAGYRGVSGRKLFDDIDQVRVGDHFTIHVLDQELLYKVEQIRAVRPEEGGDFSISDGKDEVTIVVTSPKEKNAWKLLIKGRRISK